MRKHWIKHVGFLNCNRKRGNHNNIHIYPLHTVYTLYCSSFKRHLHFLWLLQHLALIITYSVLFDLNDDKNRKWICLLDLFGESCQWYIEYLLFDTFNMIKSDELVCECARPPYDADPKNWNRNIIIITKLKIDRQKKDW